MWKGCLNSQDANVTELNQHSLFYQKRNDYFVFIIVIKRSPLLIHFLM